MSNAPRPTRYPELGYAQHDRDLWRIVTIEDNAAVGPQYATKGELLADLDRFAADYGCAGTTREPTDKIALVFMVNADAIADLDVDSGAKQRIVSLLLEALDHYRQTYPHTWGTFEDKIAAALLCGGDR